MAASLVSDAVAALFNRLSQKPMLNRCRPFMLWIKSRLLRFIIARPWLQNLIKSSISVIPQPLIKWAARYDYANDTGIYQRLISQKLPINPIAGRVVLVCGSLQPGGAERQVVNTLQGLQTSYLESVTLLCDFLKKGTEEKFDFYLPQARETGAEIRAITTSWGHAINDPMPHAFTKAAALIHPRLAFDIENLVREFRAIRPEVVHAWLDWSNVRAGLAALIAGVPKIVLSCRNLSPRHFALFQEYYEPVYRVLAKRPEVVIVNNSRAGADDYADWLGLLPNRIKVLRNGVNFDESLRPSPEATRDLRKRLDIPEGAPVIGGMFRFNPEKRPLLWIETAAHMAVKIPDARFVVFGQGLMRDEILKTASSLNIADKILLPGLVSPSFLGLSLFDVILMTSMGEGTPNVLLEAQWLGLPVVTTDAGGAAEAINPGITGVVVSPATAEALGEQVIQILANNSFRQTASKEGPLYVAQRYGMKRMIEETLALYGYDTADETCRLATRHG